jgi:hypothetical protein
MSQERIFYFGARNVREVLAQAYRVAMELTGVADRWELVLRERKRSLPQNAKLWACLQDIADQCELVINGRPQKASKEDWKQVFTAALARENRMALGLDGGVVVLGTSTSRMRKTEFSDLLEMIHAYGAEHGVHWSDPALAAFGKYPEAA